MTPADIGDKPDKSTRRDSAHYSKFQADPLKIVRGKLSGCCSGISISGCAGAVKTLNE
jgi:hypothetical protein